MAGAEDLTRDSVVKIKRGNGRHTGWNTQDGTDRMEQGVWVGRVEGESRGVRDSSEESTLGVDGGASIETGC